jgi:hypothetical protein
MSLEFKDKKVKDRSELMHYKCIQIMIEQCNYCESYGQPFVVTETATTAEEDAEKKRVSSSHREGRAWDIRTHHWKPEFIAQFVEHFEKLYNSIGAISSKDMKNRFMVDKSKTKSPHIHCQLSKQFARSLAWRK